jgi:hypothetical protein
MGHCLSHQALSDDVDVWARNSASLWAIAFSQQALSDDVDVWARDSASLWAIAFPTKTLSDDIDVWARGSASLWAIAFSHIFQNLRSVETLYSEGPCPTESTSAVSAQLVERREQSQHMLVL